MVVLFRHRNKAKMMWGNNFVVVETHIRTKVNVASGLWPI